MPEDTVGFDDILSYPYWRHRIDLRDGRVTPGVTPAADWGRIGLPDDMAGLSFLDVGCFDGLHAFEAERRGSPAVLATDVWEPDGADEWWYGRTPRRGSFELVRAYLDSAVEGRRLDVHDLDPDDVGTFDVVLCSKVLPFLANPVGAVERLVSVASGRVVVETAVARGRDASEPVLEFAGRTTENPNRWWHPTRSTLVELLESAGCRRVDVVGVPSSIPAEGTWEGTTRTDAPVSPTRARDEEVDEVPARHPVTVLADTDGARRVQYRPTPSAAYRQGWVSPSAVEPDRSGTAALYARARRRYRTDGVVGLTRAAFDALRRSLRRDGHANVVATGYV